MNVPYNGEFIPINESEERVMEGNFHIMTENKNYSCIPIVDITYCSEVNNHMMYFVIKDINGKVRGELFKGDTVHIVYIIDMI